MVQTQLLCETQIFLCVPLKKWNLIYAEPTDGPKRKCYRSTPNLPFLSTWHLLRLVTGRGMSYRTWSRSSTIVLLIFLFYTTLARCYQRKSSVSDSTTYIFLILYTSKRIETYSLPALSWQKQLDYILFAYLNTWHFSKYYYSNEIKGNRIRFVWITRLIYERRLSGIARGRNSAKQTKGKNEVSKWGTRKTPLQVSTHHSLA